jgi:LuxR family maltose regulon positive regulatory protein
MPQQAAYTLTWCEDDRAYQVSRGQENSTLDLVPESPAWEAWLQTISSFAFHGQLGSYTARKEHQERGAGYWYAYARLKGKVTKRYLGSSTDLTLARLEQVAQALTTAQQSRRLHEEAELGSEPATSSSDGGTPRTTAVERKVLETVPHPPAPLVLTKVQPPRLRAALVHRSRLLHQLQEAMEYPLTLLSAPAGFGKTTLLTSWLAESGTPAAWFSVEPEDNDPVRFFSYLLTALQRLDQHLGSSLLPLLQSPGPVPLETLLALLLNSLSAREEPSLVLMLDDYHAITSESIHRALVYLVEHLPPQLHLVLATRVDPPLPLARLRARGQLSELRATHLRFGQEEADQFLRTIMGLDLSVQESALLQTRTEGWIAGLQFAALALQGRTDIAVFLAAFSGSHRFVLDYLSEEVLARQPAAIQSFLTCTSILERLSGTLCDAVTRQEGSQSILEALERANLFVISLDEERRWYRYHHLFAEVLKNRLQQTEPMLVPELHRRASAWYEQHDLPVEAIRHALSAPDFERAARLLEQLGPSLPIGLHNQRYTVLSWFNALPDALIRARPFLCLYHAAILISANQFEAAESRLQDAERSAQGNLSVEQTRIILGHVFSLRAGVTIFSGDIPRGVSLGQQALKLLSEAAGVPLAGALVAAAHAYLVSGDVTPARQREVEAAVAAARTSSNLLAYVRGMNLLAWLHVLQGRLKEASTIYEQVVRTVPKPESLRALAISSLFHYFGLGNLQYQRNSLNEAAPHLALGMEMIKEMQTVEPYVTVLGYATLARLLQARGNSAEALATLDAFVHLADSRHFAPQLRAEMAAVRAHIEVTQGHLAAALRWAETSSLSPDDAELRYAREREYLTLARVRIAQGRTNPSGPFLDDALALLERLLADAQAKGRMHSVLEILVLKALALQGRGDLPAALDMLAWALSLAAPEGYVRLFLDEGAPMLTLLSQVGATDPSLQDYVQRLLAHAHVSPATLPLASSLDHEPAKQHLLVEPLSERELEVLHLMASGASNEEIADKLVIAVGTAKRHVSNILAKLAVTNRTQAVARAREVGLV